MKGFIAMLSLMILLSAYPALAEPPFGGRQPGGRLLEKLIDSCRTNCFDQVRNCRDAAEAKTLSDLQNGPCSPQITAAKTACATDHTSQGCQAAKSALRSCAHTDLTQLRSALYTCRNPEVVEQCVALCNSQQ